MPTLPNSVSSWSGATLNIKNMDLVDLEATNVSCTYLTVDGETITPEEIQALQEYTQNQTASEGTTMLSGNLHVDTNALYVDGDNDKVGINTSTPSVALDVVGDIACTGDVSAGGDISSGGDLTVTGSITNSVLTVDNSINCVGINKTSPGCALDVVGDLNATGNITGDSFLVVDTNTLYVRSDTHRIGVGTSSPAMTMDIVGNTGITGTLQVSGNVTGSTGTLLVASDVSVDSGVLKVDTTNNYVGVNKSTPTVPLDVVGNTAIVGDLAVNTDDLFVKTSNGYVGINRSDPTYQLDVNGTLRTSGTATLNSVSVSNTCIAKNLAIDTNLIKTDDVNNYVGINKTSPTVALDVVGATSITGDLTVDTNVLKVDTTNNRVGINKTTPAYELDVVGTANIYGSFGCSNSSTTDVFGYTPSEGVLSQESYFDCQKSGASVFYVDHKVNSRVGIKNDNPQYTLDVTGNANVSGTLTTGNTWTTYTPSTSGLGNCTVDGLSGRYINYGAYKQALVSCQITFTASGIGTVTLSLPSSFFSTVWSITQGAGYGLGYSGLLSVGGSSTAALSTTSVACSVLGGTTSYRVRIFLNVMGN